MEVWEKLPLGTVCRIEKNQGHYPALPYVGLEHIESGTGRLLGTASGDSVKSTTFRFSTEHVLYGRLRPYLNKVLLPDFAGHCSTEIFPLMPSEQLDRRFLFYWLISESVVQAIDATSTGARMPRANMDKAMQLLVPIPALAEQRRIVAILDEAFEAIATTKANTEKNLNNARAVFETYLQEVFSQRGEGWAEATIGAVTKFIDYRGKTPAKTESGIRLITAKNIKMGYIQEVPQEFIATDNYATWMTRGVPKKGDVLFTTEAPLANVAQLDTDEKVAFAQRVIIMQPDEKRLDKTFLKYLLLSPPMQKRIREEGTGATVQGIKASLLKKIEIWFPEKLNKQEKIVTELDALNEQTQALESLYQRKLTALEELKKSLLHQAFTGQLTARAADRRLAAVA